MLLTAAALGLLAVLLAWPAPLLLAGAAWPERAPATALVLWQSIALAGVLSLLGALLTAGLTPFGDSLVDAAIRFAHGVAVGGTPPAGTAPNLLAICAALLVGAHLAANLLFVAVRTERQRRRHLDLVMLLSTPDPERPATRLIETDSPVAYCLPRTARSLTVLSSGLLELLAPDELAAVLAHERAHLSQHHTVVLTAFRAWSTAFPWLPTAARARDAVGLLVEMLADDRACAQGDDDAVRRAILAVGMSADAGDPSDRPAADPASLAARVARIGAPPLPPARRRAIIAGSVALVVGPALLLVAPTIA